MRYMTSSKYRARKTEIDGIVFDSAKEARRYLDLKLLERCGEIKGLELQVRYELLPKNGCERAVHYVADFRYEENGKLVVEDVKGVRTREYILKRKMFKYRYPEIEFRES